MKIARRLEIRGKVQGVNFRESMRKEAERIGATGWVRNCEDGSVEAVIQGDEHLVKSLVRWAHQGPFAAKVESVKTEDLPHDPAIMSFERRADS